MGIPEFQRKFEEECGRDDAYLTEALVLEVQCSLIGRMRELGLTQAELAKRMGVTQPNVSKMLNREENMTLRSIAVLANALDAEWVRPVLSPFPATKTAANKTSSNTVPMGHIKEKTAAKKVVKSDKAVQQKRRAS